MELSKLKVGNILEFYDKTGDAKHTCYIVRHTIYLNDNLYYLFDRLREEFPGEIVCEKVWLDHKKDAGTLKDTGKLDDFHLIEKLPEKFIPF